MAKIFPTSVANLLYSKFAPSAPGTSAFTLRDYVVGGRFSGSGFARFADYLCPAATSSNISGRFAGLFGVEQSDIDQMNMPEEDGGCPDGSPYSIPVVGALNRDDPLLVNLLNVTPSQTGDDLAQGNEGSLRLDYIFGSADSLFAQMNWARSTDQFGGGNLVRGFPTPVKLTTPNFQLSYIHTFKPTLMNEFRAGYTGSVSTTEAAFPGVPSILFDDSTLGFGSASGIPEVFHEGIYSYADSLTLNRGKHNMKGGWIFAGISRMAMRTSVVHPTTSSIRCFLRLTLPTEKARALIPASRAENRPILRPVSAIGETGRLGCTSRRTGSHAAVGP